MASNLRKIIYFWGCEMFLQKTCKNDCMSYHKIRRIQNLKNDQDKLIKGENNGK